MQPKKKCYANTCMLMYKHIVSHLVLTIYSLVHLCAYNISCILCICSHKSEKKQPIMRIDGEWNKVITMKPTSDKVVIVK